MSEIYIPTHLVPAEILHQLKEISQQIQRELKKVSTSSPLSSSSPSSSPVLSSRTEDDESDVISASTNHSSSSVHVTGEEVTSSEQEMTSDDGKRTSSDHNVVVNYNHPKQFTGLFNGAAVTHTQTHPVKDSEVVCVLPFLSSSPAKTEDDQNGTETVTVTQTCKLCPNSAPTLSPSASVQTSQQQDLASGHNELDYLSSASGQSQESSDSTQLCSPGDKHERNIMNTLSSSTSPVQENVINYGASPSKYFKKLSVSDPCNSATAGVHPSYIEQHTPVPSTSQQLPASSENKVVRIIPSRFATSSVNVGPRSPALLTPPETPEGERKQGVPEIFTFDDIECTQERFRLMVERLQHLQEQHTYRTSRTLAEHPSSFPANPSFDRLDLPSSVPSSPFYRRWVPPSSPSIPWRRSPPNLIQHPRTCLQPSSAPPYLKLKAAEASRPPSTPTQSAPLKVSLKDSHQLKQKAAEVSGSSPTPVQSVMSLEELQRQESLPPKSCKRLNYDIDDFSYLSTMQRFSECGSENTFSFPRYPISEPYSGRGGSGNQNVTSCVADVMGRMVPTEDRQDRRGGQHDCRDQRGNPVFTDISRLCEAVEFQNRIGLQEKGAMKKRRFDLDTDRSEYIPLCACAVMEQNLLQMAESAYRWLRRADFSSADFDRFCMQLALTNEKLRESMELLKHIRDICDHGQ